MKKEWNDVREFHEKFGHPVAESPVMIDKKRALSRAKWMQEEVAEFLIAEDIYEQADAMIDLMYPLCGGIYLVVVPAWQLVSHALLGNQQDGCADKHQATEYVE